MKKSMTIQLSEKVIKQQSGLIKRLASDEVYRAIKDDSDLDIVKTAIFNIAKNGKLLEAAAVHFPRRSSKLPKKFLSSYQEKA